MIADCAGGCIAKELSQVCPSEEIILRAKTHMTKEKSDLLSSKDTWHRKIAEGKFYEAVIYECLKKAIKKDRQYSIIAKGCDYKNNGTTKSLLGQDGIFYDEKTGDIVVRGNGQDIAEFDFILFKENTEVVFVEIKNSENNLKEFAKTVAYKRELIKLLFGQEPQFILVSSLDIRNKSSVRSVLSLPNSYFVITSWFREIDFLKKETTQQKQNRDTSCSEYNLIQISDLKTRKIHYLKTHNSCLKAVFEALQNETEVILPRKSWLIKRLIVGQLSTLSVEKLLSDKKILIDGIQLNLCVFEKIFDRIVLSLTMPELRPVFYFKVKSQPLYLKLGPADSAIFEFERIIFSQRTAFFNWLENTDAKIHPDVLNRFLMRFLNGSKWGSKRKFGEVDRLRNFYWYKKMKIAVEKELAKKGEKIGGETVG